MTTTSIAAPAARVSPRTRATTTGRPAWALPIAGIALAVALWWGLTDVLFASRPLVSQFSPARALVGLAELAASGTLLDSASISVFRLLCGLALAAVLGIGGGLLLGSVAWLDGATRPVQLFLKMVSPLSWAPVAIIAFGIGNPPVVALVTAAAVWPVLTATSEGVRRVDPGHRRVAHGLGATRWEVLRHVVLPSVQPSMLSGLRSAIGLGWVVLVPAEMLGVTSGLGYQIMNAKDQLAFHQITALILVIGSIGFVLDALARWALATRRDRRNVPRPA